MRYISNYKRGSELSSSSTPLDVVCFLYTISWQNRSFYPEML